MIGNYLCVYGTELTILLDCFWCCMRGTMGEN